MISRRLLFKKEEQVMTRKYKIVVNLLAIFFSILALVVGYTIVGGSDLSFLERFACNFVFGMQFLATVWAVIAAVRKTKKKEE